MRNNKTTLTMQSRRICLTALLLAATTITYAQDNAGGEAAGKLEGTWITEVTVLDCQSRFPLRSFPALNTFHAGNTMTDTTTGASSAARTPGLGKWDKTGPRTYSAETLAFLFNPAGVWTGVQKLSHTITAVAGEIVFESRVEIRDPAGNVTTTGCATAVGRRL